MPCPHLTRDAGAELTVDVADRTALAADSSTEVPLSEIGRKNLVDIDTDTAEDDTRVGRGDNDRLIENRRGFALTIGPRLRLPGPPVAFSGRPPDDVVVACPCTDPRMAVDAGAVHAQY